MTATPFNTGWSYRQPLGPFAAVQDVPAPPTPVTLPHDALRDADRSPDVPGKGAWAYYPPGAYTYLKTFDAPAEWAKWHTKEEQEHRSQDSALLADSPQPKKTEKVRGFQI